MTTNTPKEPNEPQNDLVNDIKNQLESEAQHLDQSITNKLDAARREALAGISHSQTSNSWWQMAYTPALAAGLAIVVFLGVINNQSSTTEPSTLASQPLQSDFEVVLTNEDFELLEEDLEFYLWLEEEAETG